MDTSDKRFSELADIVKSWIPRRTESANVSKNFWMPDQICRVCYECDSQFTIFNRRHHCRLCGKVFCSKCTTNSVPAPSDEPKTGREEWERIRVCNYCLKQWKQGIATVDIGIRTSSPGLSPSPSATSLASTKSSATGNSSNSTVGSMPYSTGPYQRVPHSSGLSPRQSSQIESCTDMVAPERSMDSVTDIRGQSSNPNGFCMNRSDDDYDEYGVYRSDFEVRHFPQADDYYGPVDFDEINHIYGSHKVHPDAEIIETKCMSGSSVHDSSDTRGLEGTNKLREEAEGHDIGDECEAAGSLYGADGTEAEPVDFENNGLLWLPPEPEDEEDEREAVLFDDDDDATGEWGYLRSSSSFGSGEYRTRDQSSEEHRKAMKNVVDGHFRALVAQLLQVENLPMGEEADRESWLEIITSLSWEAATLLKPDTSKGGGMDPGGYVKVKCVACGRRSESMVVKGVVCKKNVAHRRMTSRYEKPRFLILGGALEYQRVSNLLSSFDTLLQQEMDHLKMAVAKIDAHHPNVLLVEKSVSRFAQEYLLAKDISLVLNIKRSLLERIARCTGAQIVPSIDHLSSQKLGYCDSFHVEKFLEEHGSGGQGGKKLVKTLMFFEGCPRPLGCTILLKGANGDEMKKVKHVVQYGVFAAYHLALETSFLADEGASLPELPLKSPLTVALPDKPSSIDRSISTIPGFTVPAAGKECQPTSEPQRSYSASSSGLVSPFSNASVRNTEKEKALSPCSPEGPNSHYTGPTNAINSSGSVPLLPSSGICESDKNQTKLCLNHALEFKKKVRMEESLEAKASSANRGQDVVNDDLATGDFRAPEPSGGEVVVNDILINHDTIAGNQPDVSRLASLHQDGYNYPEEQVSSKEEFPPSPSDHQSILVSLSTRCVWKGTVCERAHLFRIKYYGSFDKPLGRFLRDHLFDQSYHCRLCEMPSEAHVHCYTHRQGSLTISVKKFPDPLLPGEREGKIWMWHRCLRCPRINNFPPATRRVVMSDAAWGLSFGKFLELSFSNHAAASRVASCGHSLHRDCLRFYGFGRMVACFRYASIDVHSVYLPPKKLDFNYENQEWTQKEANEVVDRAEILFNEVLNALHQMAEKRSVAGSVNNNLKAPESRHHISELEGMLQKEKAEFEESLQKALYRGPKKGQPVIDILEISWLRRQLLFHSYLWDRRLIYASSLDNSSHQEGLKSSLQKCQEKYPVNIEKSVEMNLSPRPDGGLTSTESLADTGTDGSLKKGGEIGEVPNHPGIIRAESDSGQDSNHRKEGLAHASASSSLCIQSDPLESRVVVRRVLSEGHFPLMENLSDTLDVAWTGENHPGSVPPTENGYRISDAAIADSSVVVEAGASAVADLVEHLEDHSGVEATQSLGHALPTKQIDTLEDSTSWIGIHFLNFYHSFNKNSSRSALKFDTPSEYNPVYVSSFWELERQGGARLLLPVGVNDTVVPVYDDEPTSIIAYSLVSPDYHLQISDDPERPKDGGESSVSQPFFDAVNLHSPHSFDETAAESIRSLDSILSMSGFRSSLALDPLLYAKALHVRVSFTDDGPLGKVKYTVTCYYAKRFETLRRTCCPSELDFIRSLSRCKKWGAQGGKSNVFFAKTLDDRFVIKQVTKTELESFIKFAPEYFKYLSESIGSGSPTCLAKILGIYQVTSKQLKGGKEFRMDVLVMENLLFGRNVTKLYDLKGSSRSRYNPDSSGSNKVLLDQNLIEAMPTSPIFVGNKAKRLLERAVWNDTAFLAVSLSNRWTWMLKRSKD